MGRFLRALATIVAGIGLLTAAAAGDFSPFTEEGPARGLDYVMSDFPQPYGLHGRGAGFADFDNDGDPDVVILGAADGTVGIFENIGGGYFVDHSATCGIAPLLKQEAFTAVDYDADGLIDLYITQHDGLNTLYRNTGNFSFVNATFGSGVHDDGPGTGSSWGDYDGDGWLDLYVCNYSAFTPFNSNLLYRNNGDTSFGDVAPGFGLDSAALSFQTVWSDYDRDGDLDLYMSNDRGPLGFPPNQLWRNDAGTLVNVSGPSGANVSLYSMGLAAGDFDGNLYPDYYVTNVWTPNYNGINPLLLNQGDGTFVESAGVAGVANYITSWGAIFFDFDNNGHKDLYVNNMWVPNSFFANDGSFPCEEIAHDVGVTASYDPTYDPEVDPTGASIASFTSAVADVDGDGDLDLLVNNVGGRAELFINHEGSKRNHVRYRVVGEYPNQFAVGANIETWAGSRMHWDESYAGGNGYLGQNELIMHVGLDDATVVDQALVSWPGGSPTRTLTGLPANETWTIYPPGRLCDVDGAGEVNYHDLLWFSGCFLSGFVPGCEMMDADGNSTVYVEDLDTCFVDAPSDCNGNGTEDLVEIVLGPEIDGDFDAEIDCCGGGPTPFPNDVGDSLRLAKNGIDVELSWDPAPADAAHDPATSYDLFRATAGPQGDFAVLANAVPATFMDTDAAGEVLFYVVGARNACGTSGEEPY